jgi:hypothetical protein
MSITQEYEQIRKELGEERFARIEIFLAAHPDILLGDVYYNERVWKQFEEEEKEWGDIEAARIDLSGAFREYDKIDYGDLEGEEECFVWSFPGHDAVGGDTEVREYAMGASKGYKLVAHEIHPDGRDEDGVLNKAGKPVTHMFFIEGKEGRREKLSEREIEMEEVSLFAHPHLNDAPGKVSDMNLKTQKERQEKKKEQEMER